MQSIFGGLINMKVNRRTLERTILALLLAYALIIWSSGLITGAYRGYKKFFGRNIMIVVFNTGGGGVSQWKGEQEWALEYESIINKRRYADLHGYDLKVQKIPQMKKYMHEFRESWEKVDYLRRTFRENPHIEWIWYMDMTTFIMEPSIPIETYILNRLDEAVLRNITQHGQFNPLNIAKLDDEEFRNQILADKFGMKEDLENYEKFPVNMIITQDCLGFNLGSFLIRRSQWTETLLDLWWDPLFYETHHSVWEHKEQDNFEYLYSKFSWVRESTAFVPQKMINAFPPGACADFANDPRFFYNIKDRDFVVNMAGCEWGRDCLGEMRYYKSISQKFNTGWLD